VWEKGQLIERNHNMINIYADYNSSVGSRYTVALFGTKGTRYTVYGILNCFSVQFLMTSQLRKLRFLVSRQAVRTTEIILFPSINIFQETEISYRRHHLFGDKTEYFVIISA
jgi:hypothetical protein